MKKKFCQTLKDLRVSAGYSQKQVYEMIGVPQSTFSSWETGKAEPSASMTLKLCEIYGVNDILQAFGYDGYNEDGSIQLNINEIDLIEKYRSLDPYGRETIDLMLNREVGRMSQLNDMKSHSTTILDFTGNSGTPERIIQYFQKVSAGDGELIYEDFSSQISIPDISKYKRVAYAVKVSGHSMEPKYHDGDTLLIEPTCIIDKGDIGIFNIDGKAYVKKRGETELISLNTDYANIPLTRETQCMGLVIDRLT